MKLYTEQAVSGDWDVNDLVGRTEERAAIQLVANTYHSPPMASVYKACLENQYTFILKMATAVFAKTLENLQHSMRLITEN
jgi:hypothetical protein